MPPVYFGRPGFSTYTGTLTFSEALVNLMLTELCSQLKKGWRQGDRADGWALWPLRRRSALSVFRLIISREDPSIRVIAHKECVGATVDGEVPSDHAGLWENIHVYEHVPRPGSHGIADRTRP